MLIGLVDIELKIGNMIIEHQKDVVFTQNTTVLCHYALRKEIQDFLFKHHLVQLYYIAKGTTKYLYIYLDDKSCVIVRY